MPVPVSLILDDGAPVNPMYFLHPVEEHKFLVPNSFTKDFAEVCREHGARGKYSVLPMPSGLGRVDRGLTYVPRKHLEGFLSIVREDVNPLFDITPEILTHQMAYDAAKDRLLHVYEDEWVARSSVGEMTDYFSLALRILKNVGLNATGFTSPWSTGRFNEKQYAEAIGRSMYRVHRRKFAWYFLHILSDGRGRRPWLVWQDRKKGLKVVTVPATTSDVFWVVQEKGSKRAAKAEAGSGADRLLTKDGKDGRLRELFDNGQPMVILTHWQSLWSEGNSAGLRGLETVFRRIRDVFADQVEWAKCSELARMSLGKRK